METGQRQVLKQSEVKGLIPITTEANTCGSPPGMALRCPSRSSITRRISRKGKTRSRLRVWILRLKHGCRFQQQQIKPARSWLCFRHRPRARWWRAGPALVRRRKFLKKKNTFNDYLDVCDALIEQGYGDPQLCFGMGGSAGGLLMGRPLTSVLTASKGSSRRFRLSTW